MKRTPPMEAAMRLAAIALVATLLPSRCASLAVTPIEKVIEMLDGMVTKAEGEIHQEKLQYAAYSQFCTDVAAEKKRVIAEADEEIEALKASVLKHNTEVERLTGEIDGHIQQAAQLDRDLAAAKAQREVERKDYAKLRQDLSESVYALDKAIAVLKAQDYDRKGTMALLELPALPKEARRALQAFLQDADEPDLEFKPEVPVTAYKPRSGEIIKMLEGLQVKFTGELNTCEKDEVDRKHTFTMLQQELENSQKAEETARAEKTASKAKHAKLSEKAAVDLKEVTATREADAKYLADLEATCATKADEYKARMKLRSEEVQALEEAIAIMSSDKVSTGQKRLPSAALLQHRRSATSLVQLRAGSSGPSKTQAADYLAAAANRLSSRMLSTIAMRVREDPFGKVKKLIVELIDRLMMEATRETEQKGWCDKELATNAHTRKTKSEEVEMLSAEIEELEANIAQLKKDVSMISGEIAEIDVAVSNATDLRGREKAENEQIVAEAKEAQVAVAQAVKVLKDFYAKAAEATAFAQKQIQVSRQEPPPIFQKPYKGQQSETGGVVGMLEVIISDFERLEQETNSEEQGSQAEYDKFMEDSAISKTQKEKDVKYKTDDKNEKEATLIEKQGSLSSAQRILKDALDSFEKLKPACIDTGMTYEERVARREQEIEALKEALKILEGVEVS